MKGKRIIKFYFAAGRLNRTIDNLIIKDACRTEGNGEYYINKIIDLIEVKKELSVLWVFLDGIISKFDESERKVLEFYGKLRFGLRRLDILKRREVRRVMMKFYRRARGIDRFDAALKLVNEYYALM